MQPKIRINDLARELEVKSKEILDLLPALGVAEKKTHSSSIEVDEAEKVRQHFTAHRESPAAKEARAGRPGPEEIKPKFDLSHISKPGDVLKAIQQKTAPATPATRVPEAPPRPGAAVQPRPAAPAAPSQPPLATRPAEGSVLPPPPPGRRPAITTRTLP